MDARLLASITLALFSPVPVASPVPQPVGGERPQAARVQDDTQLIQVAAFRYFVVQTCATPAPIYPGGCLLSIKRAPVSDNVLERLRAVAVVGRPEPGDWDVQDAVSVAFAKKRAHLVDIGSLKRRNRNLAEVDVELFDSPLGASVCTGLVRRLPSGKWRLSTDDVRCSIS